MRKLLLLLTCLIIGFGATSAQKKIGVYGVGFYNLENLFDTCHDAGKNDYEFLPEGSYRWNGLKYTNKLRNMSRVLSEMGTDVLPEVGCAIIGVSEVENKNVLDALVAQPALAQKGFKYIHVEGPDKRGVDCALLYNPQFFAVNKVSLPPYVPQLERDSNYITRGFLTVEGTMAGDDITIMVCHWPSRFAGSYYRELAAQQVKVLKDSLLATNPQRKILVMGDMNDDPTNRSMTEMLSCKAEIEDVQAGDMYNPWYNVLTKQGTGTLMYNGAWNLFDQIVLTPNMLNKNGKKDFSSLKYWKNQIFRRDYMFQTSGQYKGTPKRTTAGGVWLNGYSDHLPVIVYLVKEQ